MKFFNYHPDVNKWTFYYVKSLDEESGIGSVCKIKSFKYENRFTSKEIDKDYIQIKDTFALVGAEKKIVFKKDGWYLGRKNIGYPNSQLYGY